MVPRRGSRYHPIPGVPRRGLEAPTADTAVPDLGPPTPTTTGAEPGDTPRRRGKIAVAARWAWEWTKSLAVAFLLFLLIRTFAVEAFRIPTGSMEQTLLVGDFLLVNKAVYGAQVPGTSVRLPAFGYPARGEVVVFMPPHDPTKHYVKRLVGLPGDTLAMQDKTLTVNGEPVAEPYARHEDPLDAHSPDMNWQAQYLTGQVERLRYRPTRDNWGPIVVPPEQYFVLGDNRDDSQDSRYWGFVDGEAIRGKPLFVYYSFNPRTLEQVPWLTEIRWDRIGGAIH